MKDKIRIDCSKENNADYTLGMMCEICGKKIPTHKIVVRLATMEDEDYEITPGKIAFCCWKCTLEHVSDIIAINNVALHLVVDFLGEAEYDLSTFLECIEDE